MAERRDSSLPVMADVLAAAAAIQGVVDRTPLLPAQAFRDLVDADLYLKCENLQRTGSFKARGAYNCLRMLSAEARTRGVVAASAGNHAQGVALAAARLGVEATIVMPEGAPLVKIEATRRLGAQVELSGPNFEDAFRRMEAIEAEKGATIVHPFDDPAVISGQGTVGLEILEDLPDVETVVVPVGGGGLISGVALAIKSQRPEVKIIGVQAAAAPALFESVQAGRLVEAHPADTLADGLALKGPRQSTFDMIRRYVDDMVLVDEDEIARAILLLLERTKLLVEGAGSVAVAALLSGKIKLGEGQTVAVVSGGNIDVNVISRIIERGLISDGRYLRLRTWLADRPGALLGLVKAISSLGANVISVYHDRLKGDTPLGQAEVDLLVQTRNRKHGEEVLQSVTEAGYRCESYR